MAGPAAPARASASTGSDILAALRRHRPTEGELLLLQVALADLETARNAWAQWNARQNLADAPNTEVRILAAVARRMAEILPDVPADPRLSGARRHIWTLTQMTLSATRPLLAALQGAGLRLMLLKGAARVAQDLEVAKERALQDIDVLIHLDDWDRGLDLALREGWVAFNDVQDRSNMASGHAIGLISPTPGAKGSLDLHRYPIKESRNRGQDLGMWARAEPANLQGIPVAVPSVTDQVLITLANAMHYNRTPHPPHWALDVHPRIRAGQVDWDLLLEEVATRRIERFVAAPLLMLEECLNCPIPTEAMRFVTRPMGKSYQVEFEARATRYDTGGRELIEAVRIAAAARALRVARMLPKQESARSTPPVVRRETLGPREWMEIPVPQGAPFDRLRVEVSFRIQRAGKRAYLRFDTPGLPLKVMPIARSGWARRWFRRSVTMHAPACLFALRDMTTIRLRTSKRLSLRDVEVRWGPPRAKGWLAKLLARL